MPDAGRPSQNFVDVLLQIHTTGQSGILRFEKGTAKKQVIVRNGDIACAESNLPEEHLARILVKLNRLPRADLTQVTDLMKAGKNTEEAVLATQRVDAAGLEDGVREQALLILASLFSWDSCETRFYPGDGLSRRQVGLKTPIPQMLVLAARRAVDTKQLPDALKKLDGYVTQDGSNNPARLNLPLDNLEGQTYSLVREPIAVKKLLDLIPSGSVASDNLLLRLFLLGLLRLESPSLKTEGGAVNPTTAAKPVARRVEELLEQYEVADHYEILSVATDAGEEQIKNAYHELAKEFHPDRFQTEEYTPVFRSQVEKLFTYITGAYTTLSEPAARASYDDTRRKEGGRVEAVQRAITGVDAEQEKMAESLYRSGRAFIGKGDFEKAVTCLKTCVWTRPDLAHYRHYLGVAQSEIPKLRKEAEDNLLRAITLEPMMLESRIALGKLYIKVNLPKRAETQFQEVLRWDPENPEANKMLQTLSN